MKNLLIISPHFPPVNAADMHRVRQSVNYFSKFGWIPTVVAVDPAFIENAKDELLLQSIPDTLNIHYVNAFNVSWTRKLGLGALALRSLLFYFLQVNRLLKQKKFDLIYFSTTQFPVLILGRYWRWRFKIPYILDMQDPWHSDFYRDKPESERPPKYWFSYRLNKFLEPIAMKEVAGIIAVSQGYCDMLQSRYPNITPRNCVVIPFGAFEKDFEIANSIPSKSDNAPDSKFQITYIGRGGADMSTSLNIIFRAFKLGLNKNYELFSKVKFSFIGTSYAKSGSGIKTIEPLAKELDIEQYVNEITDRIPYFEGLRKLMGSDVLLIPGSSDPNYTASKIYPYILAKKPIIAVFSSTSSVIKVLSETNAGEFLTFDNSDLNIEAKANQLYEIYENTFKEVPFIPQTNWKAFESYTATEMTKKQVLFFDKILSDIKLGLYM